MADPWTEPVQGGYPAPRFFGLSGAEHLRSLLEGEIPQPPISRLTGMRLSAIGDGTAEFTMPLTRWLCTPQGTIGIGPLVMPADAAMACALQTQLPAATPLSTSELSLRLLAPARVGSTVTVRGRVIQLRRTIGLADGTVTDEDGRLIAHGSTLCFIQPAVSLVPSGDRDGGDASADRSPSGVEPWTLPAAGEIVGQDVWARLTGLEVLSAQLSGEIEPPPLSRLTGLRLTAMASGEAAFEMPTSEWLCAPARGRVQGGATALLAEVALNAAIQSVVPADTALAPIDLKVNYLRPLPADGRPAVARGELVHSGRRVAVANSRVFDTDGRMVAVATGSALLLPGRPASLGAAED